MSHRQFRTRAVSWWFSVAGLIAACACAGGGPGARVTVLVMDPMCVRLSCACVAGHAQRRYEVVGRAIGSALGRPVALVYGDRLSAAAREAGNPASVVIGPRSSVEHQASRLGLRYRLIAALTDRTGSTNLHGLFVARARDRARTVADLRGRRVLLGPDSRAEKSSAARAALAVAGALAGTRLTVRGSCTPAAADVHAGEADAAVISSYALPLLAGCGAVPKGALKVIGSTRAVPFIGAYVADSLREDDAARVTQALLALGRDAQARTLLETRDGFVSPPQPWSDWRGAGRRGAVSRLPGRLPSQLTPAWRTAMAGPGVGGIAATETEVFISDKSADRRTDVFRCLDADTGRQIWRVVWPAAGKMDTTNSPRATPVVDQSAVYLMGAFGRLARADRQTGRLVWVRDLPRAYGASVPTWGYSATPLLVDGKLIVNPGAADASVVALDPRTGRELWRSPGRKAAYASFIVAEPRGRRQVIGYDAETLGGWEIETGWRLWELRPPESHDYNVPTPVMVGSLLLVATENNGARLYDFDDNGRIRPTPAAEFRDFAPDTSSPVAVGDLLVGGAPVLRCLSVSAGLRELWGSSDRAYERYFSVIGAPGRALILTLDGTLTLLNLGADRYAELGRAKLPAKGDAYWSHPAVVGSRLYLRSSSAAYCFDIK